VDEKGRVLLSKKYQERLGKDFTICVSSVGCVMLIPEDRWLEMYDEISSGSGLNLWREQYSRLVLGDLEDEQNLDSGGRVLIPVDLRRRARIETKTRVVIKGMGDRLEIWDRDQWVIFSNDPKNYNKDRHGAFVEAYSNAFPKPGGVSGGSAG